MHWLADLVYPQFCLGCRKPAGGGFCRACLEGLPRLDPACRFCGHPAPACVASCRECRGHAFAFDEACQAVAFGGAVREAIHRFKYSGEASRAGPLALLAAGGLRGESETVTWIPADPVRLHERGFDHGRVLAEAVASLTGLVAAPLLERIRSTPPQIALTPGLRRRNQEGSLRARLPAPPEVIVVDDVFTTGSTVSEAARALKAAGARKVLAVCTARTLSPAGPRGFQTYNESGFPSGSVVAGPNGPKSMPVAGERTHVRQPGAVH